MLLQSVVCTFIISSSQAIMNWEISNTPIIYGNDIILTCETGKTLNNDSSCPVRQWFSGIHYKQLLYNSFSSDLSKYEDRTDLSATHFSLVVKNCTEDDLNINYTCSCGFDSITKNLSINGDNLIVQPERKDVTIQENVGKVSVKINLQRVYPRPKCHVVIRNQSAQGVFNPVKEIVSVRNGLFYDFAFEKDFVFTVEDCKQIPKIVCEVGHGYTIVNVEIKNCTGVSKHSSEGGNRTTHGRGSHIYRKQTVEAVFAVVFAAGGTVVICIAIRICRKTQNVTRTPTADVKRQSVDPCDSEIGLIEEI